MDRRKVQAARRLYESGVELLAIQQNLGHADLKTTQGYIGTLDADARKPKRVYAPPNWSELIRKSGTTLILLLSLYSPD